jgi:hypothetical protein
MTIAGTFRGGLQVAQTLYGAWTGEVYAINQSGELTLFSTLAGDENIFIARNNAATPNIAVVSDQIATIINTTAGAVQNYPDGDVGSPTCVAGHMGYFMFGYGDGDIQSSDLNSTNLNTLNTARTESNPDGVVNIVSYQGKLFVFGEKTVEIWGDPVNASGFPLTRIGYHATPGLLTPFAIAGWEPEFGNPFLYVGSDNTVRQMVGFDSIKVSPPDLDRLIADVVFKPQLEAICYVVGGHAFWQLNGPTWSWVYSLNNQKWHERKSHNILLSTFKRYVAAFDKWLVGDRQSTDLLEVQHDLHTEAGEPIVVQMESAAVKDFPNRIRVARSDFDFVTGVGDATGLDPIETDPTVRIEWSDDGGKSWSTPWNRKLGRQAITQQRITVLNTGMSGPMGRKWRWTVSDPVHVGFLGSAQEAEVRNK